MDWGRINFDSKELGQIPIQNLNIGLIDYKIFFWTGFNILILIVYSLKFHNDFKVKQFC